MASMYGQWYTRITPSFTMPSHSLTPYTSGFNGRAYPNPSRNFHAPYTTISYTEPIPLLGSSLGFLPNHASQSPPRFSAYSQPEAGSFGFETPLQFPFRPQPVDMMPTRATVKPSTDPNNLTNQLATILCESFGIEPKGRGHVYQNRNPTTMTSFPTLEAIESLCFLSLVGRMVGPH
jgi:hypothetical protein